MKMQAINKSFAWQVVSAITMLALTSMSFGQNVSKDFQNLVNGTALISYFKVALPGDMYQINGKPGDGWVYYEGEIQGNTFWVRNCTNSIPGSGPAMPGCTVGTSSNDNW